VAGGAERVMRLVARLAAAGLPALAACSLSPDPRDDRPDATVAFATDWQSAADCSAQQLGSLFTTALLTHHPDQGYAEIVVGIGADTAPANLAGALYDAGNPTTGGPVRVDNGTIMLVDFRDVGPRQAQAKIYAARYMLLPGGATARAAEAMGRCRTGAP
jgi:hypothetical protein